MALGAAADGWLVEVGGFGLLALPDLGVGGFEEWWCAGADGCAVGGDCGAETGFPEERDGYHWCHDWLVGFEVGLAVG